MSAQPTQKLPGPGRSGSLDAIARRLIQHAARTAPPALAARLEEEWLADLEGRRSGLARLGLGLGCCWATRVIASEHAPTKALAASTTTGSETMAAYLQHDEGYFSRRTTAVLAIIGVHVLVIYALAVGLARNPFAAAPPDMTVVPMPDVTRHIDPPPPPEDPRLTPPTLKIPRPDVPVYPQPETPTIIDVTPVREIDEALPPLPQKTAVTRVSGGPGKGFPNTEDFYPAAEIRAGITGVTMLQACVDEKGRLTAPPTVLKSSGSEGLDGGAVKLARAGSGHYRPATEDGRPVNSCFPFNIRFDFTRR